VDSNQNFEISPNTHTETKQEIINMAVGVSFEKARELLETLIPEQISVRVEKDLKEAWRKV
jgi:hypothetical protein